MGYAKYTEDLLEDTPALQDYYFGYSTSNVTNDYSLSSSYIGSLKCEKSKKKEDIPEFLEIYVNNQKLFGKEKEYTDIYSLSLKIPKSITEIEVSDDMGNYYKVTNNGIERLYNISAQVLNTPFSKLFIKNPSSQDIFSLNQKINLKKITNADIYNHKYSSESFDKFVSEDTLDENGYLTYLKLLVSEGADTSGIIGRACMTSFYKNLSSDFYWTYFLSSEFCSKEFLMKSKLSENAIMSFIYILNGEFNKAENLLGNDKSKTQDILGCKILLGLLRNDWKLIDYQKGNYTPQGYIGSLISLLFDFKNNCFSNTKEHLYNLSLIKQYPLIKAVFALYDFESFSLTRNLYPLVSKLDYKVPLKLCTQINDRKEQEKFLKDAVEHFPDSEELLKLSNSKDFSWTRKYISCSSSLYSKELKKLNSSRKNAYKDAFLESLKFDNEIEITNLGKGELISANCILISYKGYNILIDVGLDPRKSEQLAYPCLDGVTKFIDYIVVSHAHIDHCGGLPKAHAMWPNAKIIATAPTKRLMRYLFNDAAKIKNEKYSEFEITNIALEKETINDTLLHTIETDYEQWICVCEDLKFRLHNAGHMIGSSMIEIRIKNKTILYTGDFTDFNQSLSFGTDFSRLPKNIDLLISEATYVEKNNFEWSVCYANCKKQIVTELNNRRTVLIPAAAIGKAQELICMLGVMAINGELPINTKLYIGGLAIPMTTQISPYFNEKYDLILEKFNELGPGDVPDENSVIVASSNFLSKGSASYRVLQNICMRDSITIFNNTKISGEAEAIIYKAPDIIVRNYFLPTHADKKGIKKLLDWTKPTYLSFIHCGGKIDELKKCVSQSFDNDIIIYESKENKQIHAFDLLKLIEEGLV